MGVAPMSGRTRGRTRAGRVLLAGLVTVVAASVSRRGRRRAVDVPPVRRAAVSHASGAKLTPQHERAQAREPARRDVLHPEVGAPHEHGHAAGLDGPDRLQLGPPVRLRGQDRLLPRRPPSLLKRGHSCVIQVVFTPRDFGPRQATISIITSAAGSPQKLTLAGNGTEGYFLAGSQGGVAQFGDAVWHGDRRTGRSSAPIISITTTLAGAGYWLLGADGGIFSFGNAKFYGSTGAMRLNQPVVGMASCARATATGSSRPTAGSSRSAPRSSTDPPAGCT